MNLIFLGPPGSGKGTQSRLVKDRREIMILSTGEMLRSAIASGSEIGKKVETVMAAGQYVPDDIMISMIADRIEEPDCRKGFILDGFPRTTRQAEALDGMLKSRGLQLDGVIEMQIDEEELVRRIVGRFSCTKCGAGYHMEFQKPKVDGVCDVCGSTEFSRRPDDNVETVKARLETYRQQTSPLLPYYCAKGVLKTVDAIAEIEEVARQVESALTELAC